MRRLRNAKIVATLGPASSTPELIDALFEAGADVFRLNFSHGTHEDHRQRFEAIRAVERKRGRPIGVLLDLQGPKLRIGTFADGPVQLAAGAGFRLDLDSAAPGSASRVCLPHPEIFAALSEGVELLLDDGKIRLRVEQCGAGFAETTVVNGGTLSDRKGVNVPDAVLPLSAMTEKDRRDLDFGLALGADWIALSFVQRPEDIREIKAIVNGRAGIVAKLEKPAAIQSLDLIVAEADAIMVARGDLGVEMPAEQVPSLQKQIVRACRKAGKPVIVATQMLESMIAAPVPTRAEASDVATAIYDGADAVMLSAESASGRYPVEAVRMMNSIISRTESDPLYRDAIEASHTPPRADAADAIGYAVRHIVGLLRVPATVAYTSSGYSALRMARERPQVPILGMTPRMATARRLTLTWGVHAVLCHEVLDVPEMTDLASRTVLAEGFGEAGQSVVISAGLPFLVAGTTNLLRIAQIQ
ncbi:pyruvate kinase [Cupriavidus necator]|uniref:Pyruvate kinase n=1 Tax=Cupriavidus necator (strain ATCC 17699 / DSM 428 / KCTC 22496 / NCIMB 10442 / H16 / Stanier 337) TaxID=381666 RepID=Q0K2M2_CUPNH|nr:pyruvate kinase [Cupriavidus necator]QCC03643.1 pyruvate kinase [Cupriavidus necator H16]QQB80698.1 pyruvate kinase [Cupriavidus necator]WKA44989.1 pyruvate kinase [Cupriavidus necator]CAJ95752.1 pyruvate kinase [Cupriavidus necator H16]